MNNTDQQQLGKTLWNIADQLRGAMNADDFRDYMLSFLFLRYLSDNYESAVKKELGKDYPKVNGDGREAPLSLWYAANKKDVADFEKQMRRKVHYVIKPEHLWASIANLARRRTNELLNTLQKGFKYIEEESFPSKFQGLFSEINLGSDKLGKIRRPQRQALLDHQEIAEGLARFLDRRRHAGRCLRVPDRAVRGRLGEEGRRVLHAAADFEHPLRPSSRSTARSRRPASGSSWKAVFDFACGSGSLLLNVRHRMGPHGHRQDLRAGEEHHDLQPRAHEHAAARGEGHGVRNLPRRHADQRLGHAARDEPRQEAEVRRGGGQSAVQLPLGAERGDGRGHAVQEPRAGPEERGRLRVPAARAFIT